MKKERKKALGYTLILLGIITIFLKPLVGVTGFSIASEAVEIIGNVWFFLVGWGMIVAGIVLTVRGAESHLVEISESDAINVAKIKPGKGIKGDYIPLREILEKGTLVSNRVNVAVKGGSIYRDGRLIQGLRVVGGEVEFIGYHFTNSDAASIIEQDQGLERKNPSDPYVYLLEAMSYSGMGEKQIRHMIGSSSAEEALSMKIKYPIDKIYLKFNKDRPTHYAIEGNVGIEDMILQKGEYIRRKKIDEL